MPPETEAIAKPALRSANKDWLRALEMTGRLEARPNRILPSVIDEQAERLGEAPALLSESETLSFPALAGRVRRYGRWALESGLGKGDVVALLMPNRPEYLAAWLGLTRVGVVTGLLNPELRGASLAHCVGVARAKRIIVDARLAGGLLEAIGVEGPPIVVHGEGWSGLPRIDLELATLPAEAAGPEVTLADPALLIYTSGTTGLPKAARVSHHRVMSWSYWFAGLADIRPTDRLYDCLPLCHSAGGVAAVGAALVGGASTVIAPKFSASRFWDEVTDWECTLFQYIGELCRYLLAAPPHPRERAHRLRLCCGNGLAGDVWTAFQQRFAVPQILEFYAATEGTFSLYNVEGKPGAIGRVPPLLRHRFPAAIVKYDADARAPARNPEGFCIPCASGEAGEAIGRIASQGTGRFEGYTDIAESQKKLLRDVFAPGDAWFRTGDLMRQDDQAFWYFVDRIGDTFRWKGENVSAAEVAEALRAFPGIRDASVYGVVVPGAGGRAGMAAVVAGPDFDLAVLPAHLAARLPDYARPVFLRLVPTLAVTETFKPKKAALAEEGYDPGRSDDPLYLYDRERGAYVGLDADLLAQVREGRLRL
ncbi:MAG: long-chain-acyl-CoA synthetase [Caulobacteraceae bacterium]|nr:long-chain-acyl-CoA synthetase [Caulobacteraceae bacterium]